ncbi:MAG: hypothetical protein H0U42_03335 [Thermoleophilaceae bacterium]|nr:hypothetical protein [Thermoleophilaceae bacterium]
MTAHPREIALLVALFALTAVGCGGGGEPDPASTTAPELISPGGTEGSSTSSTSSTPEIKIRTVEEAGSSDGGSDSEPVIPEEEPVEEEPPPPPPDNPKNDTPPPPGSSAERFESFCQENPKECGF